MTLHRVPLTVLAMVCLAMMIVGTASATFPELSAATSPAPPRPSDEAAIRSVIDRAFWLDGAAARTFDVSQFSTVYTNDPSVALSPEQADLIARVNGSSPNALLGSGFLDYKRALYYHWQSGASKMERIQAKASSEDRQMTPAELQSIAENGQPPALRRTDPNYHTALNFQSVTIDGDHAEAVFDSGLVLERMYLLRTQAGWRFIAERLINVHF